MAAAAGAPGGRACGTAGTRTGRWFELHAIGRIREYRKHRGRLASVRRPTLVLIALRRHRPGSRVGGHADHMTDYTRALEVAVAAAREAGELLRRDLHRPDGPRGARGHAEADTEAEHVIRARLLEAFPFAYLGEETGSALGGPSADGHLWIVDPNDGTQSYTAGMRGSAVSIAALRDGVPVLGVVYAFAAPDDAGDLFAWAQGCGPIVRNGKPVENDLATDSLARGAIVVVSQHGDWNAPANLACVAPARFRAMPSIAYRLALVAVGEGVAAVSLNGPVGWDYAAGHALVRAAGGVLLDQHGHEVTYGLDGRSGVGGACFGGGHGRGGGACGATLALDLGGQAAKESSLRRAGPRLARGGSGMLARAQGCLLGQVAGDSLGSLVEFESPRAIAARYPTVSGTSPTVARGNTIAGQPTDDSELALALARSIVAEGRYDPGAAVEAYASWYQSVPSTAARRRGPRSRPPPAPVPTATNVCARSRPGPTGRARRTARSCA